MPMLTFSKIEDMFRTSKRSLRNAVQQRLAVCIFNKGKEAARKQCNASTTVDMGSGQTIARAKIAEGARFRAGG
jgi:hypothetical protein